jgi:hypothetical protein
MSYNKWSEQKLAKYLKEGRGQGEGADYKPWLTVQDFSSTGRCHRPPSTKVGRHLELFSDVEYGVFLLADRARSVLDIREQYPLDRELTREIAIQLNIKHPVYPATKVDTVMTLDFLLTVRDESGTHYLGVDAKTRDKLEDSRTIEKLQIVKSALSSKHISHVVVIDDHLPKQTIRNLNWLHEARPKPVEVQAYPGYWTEMADRLLSHLKALKFGKQSLRNVCIEFNDAMGWPDGTALRAVRILLDTWQIDVDLSKNDVAELPLSAFKVCLPETAIHSWRGCR